MGFGGLYHNGFKDVWYNLGAKNKHVMHTKNHSSVPKRISDNGSNLVFKHYV